MGHIVSSDLRFIRIIDFYRVGHFTISIKELASEQPKKVASLLK